MVSKYLDNSKADTNIIDFACGSGLVGEALSKEGYKNITGIDISQKMLDQAAEKKVYSNLHKFELCQNDHIGSFPMSLRNKFDFVTAAGLINNNYMDEKLFEQMLLSLREFGYLVFTARFSYLGDYWYVDKLAELEKAGRIKSIDSESFFKYDKLGCGIGRFGKTPVKVFVY